MQGDLKAIPKIAQLRDQAGLTQLELSRRIGVTENTIQNWEKGRAGVEQIERLIKLCKALNCKLEDLIDYAPAAELAKPKEEIFSTLCNLLNNDVPAQTTPIETNIKQ